MLIPKLGIEQSKDQEPNSPKEEQSKQQEASPLQQPRT